MKIRTRNRRFNKSHPVKTFRVTSDMAEFVNALGTAERKTFVSKALHKFLNNGRPTHSRRSKT